MSKNPATRIEQIQLYLRYRRQRQRMYAIYEKYSQFTMIQRGDFCLNLQLAQTVRATPGAVVECGVWRGGMSAGLAEILGPERSYVLCDSFQGLPDAQPIDGQAALEYQSDPTHPEYHDNCTAPEEAARSAMALSPATNVQFVAGWFEATVPHLHIDNPIALLRLDGDWYESTMTCLEHLYPRVAPGGLIIIDDYHTWDGCTRAVHDYLSRHSLPARISQWADRICYIRIPETHVPVKAGPPGRE
jgi:O-methyltransferase